MISFFFYLPLLPTKERGHARVAHTHTHSHRMAWDDSEVWTSMEERTMEEFEDASGKVQMEAVQDMPPPSLTKGGLNDANVHALERHTGSYSVRPARREVMSETSFDTDAEDGPLEDTRQMANARTEYVVDRNRSGTTEFARKDAEGREAVYDGYNVALADAVRERHLPVTARSVYSDMQSHLSRGKDSDTRASLAHSEMAPFLGAGAFDTGELGGRKGRHDELGMAFASGDAVMSSNHSYDVGTRLHSGKAGEWEGGAFRSSANAGGTDAFDASSVSAKRSVADMGVPSSRSAAVLSEWKDSSARGRDARRDPDGFASAASASREMREEWLKKTMDPRKEEEHTVASRAGEISLGRWDSSHRPSRGKHVTFDLPSARPSVPGVPLDPNRDASMARDAFILQPSTDATAYQSNLLTSQWDSYDIRDEEGRRDHQPFLSAHPWKADAYLPKDSTSEAREGPITHALSVVSSALAQWIPRSLRDESPRLGDDASRHSARQAARPFVGHHHLTAFDSADVTDTHTRVRAHPSHVTSSARSSGARPFSDEYDALPSRPKHSTDIVAEASRPHASRTRHPWDHHENNGPLRVGPTAHTALMNLPDTHPAQRDSTTRAALPTHMPFASTSSGAFPSRGTMAKEVPPMRVRV